MATSISPLRRVPMLWRGSKAGATTATQVEVDQHEASVQPPPQWTDGETQTSLLLTLPIEILNQIYDYLITPWTMAVLSNNTTQFEDITKDPTINLKSVGTHLISGPPTSLLLVCRALHSTFHPRFGEALTGTLILGRILGRTSRRRLSLFLTSTFKLRQFYTQITHLTVSIDLNNTRIALNFRALLPNLKRVDCIVHEGNYGPLLRLMDTQANFVQGHYDSTIVEWTKPAVNFFLCVEGRSVAPVHRGSAPWDDETAVVDVKVLGSIASLSKVIVGLHYQWRGSRIVVLSRVVRAAKSMVYGYPRPGGGDYIGTGPISEQFLQTYGWVKALK